jgi:phosphoribosylaminoimidazole-succinocarboxamide synthase
MLCRRLEMLPVEWVVRGYLSGSGWLDYQADGPSPAPAARRASGRPTACPTPILTPATKATTGHDANITRADAADLVGGERLAEVERVALAIYDARGRPRPRARADPGRHEARVRCRRRRAARPGRRGAHARLVAALVGERLGAGTSPPSFDKQYVRDWLGRQAWDRRPPGPALPPDVVAGTAARYRDAYRLLTDRPFDDYRREMEGGGGVKVTVLVRPRDGVLDPQGEALDRSLQGLGYPPTGVRQGKVFDLDVAAADVDGARRVADELAERVLSNPLIEQYEVVVHA